MEAANLQNFNDVLKLALLIGVLLICITLGENDNDQTASHSDLKLSLLLPHLGCFNTEQIGSKCKRIKSE